MPNDQNQRFALRKLSIGLASVLIGISFISAGQTVKADTVQNNASQSHIVQNDQKVKENDTVKFVQDAREQGDALNNSVVQAKQDSNNNAQPVSKQMTVQSNVQNANVREAKFDSVSQAEIINNQRVSQTTKVARISSAQDTVDVSSTDPDAKMLNNYKVIENLPNSNPKTVWDVDIESHRSAVKNLATGQVTYGDWETQKSVITNHTNNGNPGDPSFTPGINIDQVAGYTPVASSWQSSEKNNQGAWLIYYANDQNAFTFDFQPGVISATPTTYKSMPANRVFYINYTANPQSIKYIFVDDDDSGKEVLTTTVNGVTDQTVNTNLALPTNYVLAPNNTVPSTVKLDAVNNPVIIHVKHKTNNTYDFDTANRDIIVNLPNGIKHEYWQKIGFRRTKTVDLVTKQIVYGDWNVFDQTSAWRIDQTWQESKSYIIKNGAVRFAPINLPKVPGYRPILKWLNANAMQINLVKD